MVRRVEPAASERVINEALGIGWSNWDSPTHLAYSQRAMVDLWPTDIISAPENAHVLEYASELLDLGNLNVKEPGTGRSMSAAQLLERRMFNDALLVMHRGQVVHESWRNGMQETDRHVNHSTTKSLTTLLLGMAIDEELVDPGAPVTDYLPQMADLENWRKLTVQHALDMRTGLAYEEHYDDPDCICWSYFRATGYYPPQADTLPGYDAWIHRHMHEADCVPGSKFNYASPVTNALGLIVEAVYGKSVAELLEQKIYRHIGAECDAWLNLDPSGVAVTEGQLSLHLRDFARWAALFLYGGKNLAGQQVVPAAFIQDIVTPREELRKAWQLGEYASMIAPQGQYRNQTYVLDADCTQMAMLGIHGQFALVDLERELLAVGYGSYPDQVGPVFVDSMFSLWELLRTEFPTRLGPSKERSTTAIAVADRSYNDNKHKGKLNMTGVNTGNLYTAFQNHFPADTGKVLLTTETGTKYTYADAEHLSAQLANYLVALGLEPGDRVTVQVEKSPQMLWLYLATLRAGLVFHPLNTAYTEDELAYFLENAAPSAVICDAANEAMFTGLCERTGVAHLRTLNADGSGSLLTEAADCSRHFTTVETRGDDLASLLYSSGTTGRPKGIMLSHNNLIDNASVLADYWGFSADDCLLHALPVFHVHGLFVALGCVLMRGASMRWLPKFDIASVMQNLAHSTVMMGVPTYYTRLLAEPSFDAASCETVRLFISGSAPLLADTFIEFEQRTGKTILERYGMTETGMNTSNPLHGERRAGTVGFPLPGVSLRIAGPDGTEVAQGEVGDIQVRGANVFSGYWKMPDKTAEDFTGDGFFVTGDKGQIDADGYVAIVGRAKDMVISGGLNVYPKEIELLIDDIDGVLESAVIGIPHPDFGEAVVAVVVAEQGVALAEHDIIDYVKAHAANFKVPKAVHIVDSLPRNTMGKVQKNVLRDTYS